MDHPHRPERDHLEVDVRLAVQHHQLDRDPPRHHSRQPDLAGDPILAAAAIIVVNIWRGFPFAAIILLAGLTSVPQDILDAAKVDGANGLVRFRKVIVPMIAPILFIGGLFDLVFSLTDLTVVNLLTLGGPANTTHVLASYAFLVGVQSGALGRGAAIAMLLLPVLLVIIVLVLRSLAAAGYLSRGSDRRRPGRRRARTAPAFEERILVYAGLTFYAILAGLPVYWMIVTTFKVDRDLYNLKNFPLWFNQAPTLDHLDLFFHKTGFTHWLLNTLIVAVAVVSSPGGGRPGGLRAARLRFRGSETCRSDLPHVPDTDHTAVSAAGQGHRLSGAFRQVGALIVAYPTFTIPFCTWLMAGFFRTIPQEIEEAAMVDGCSRIGAIPRVVLPLSVAGMLTVAIFAFTLSMQDFIYALSFVRSSDEKVVTIGVVTELIRGDVFFWGSLMAGALWRGCRWRCCIAFSWTTS